MEKTALLAALILSAICLVILLIRRRRRRRSTYRLERDATGLWRYHRETQFQKKLSYSAALKDEGGKGNKDAPKAIAVLNFGGDLRAKQHKMLADLIDEIEINRSELSEVVVVVTSPGGMVPQYGHAYAQMERIRRLGIPLTVCIDVVAASGGYLMSLPATKILAAPFAIVGSVGVVAFVPNLRGLLTRHAIAPRTFTAGKYKRTVTLTDDATPEEVERFQQQLETIHRYFLEAVKKYRPGADVSQVETGEHWTAAESIELQLGLVDEIRTSHEYLLERNRTADLVFFSQRRNLFEDGISFFGGGADAGRSSLRLEL